MNRCRSDRGKQPRVIRCSKSEYGFLRWKFAFFFKNRRCFLVDFCRAGASPAFSSRRQAERLPYNYVVCRQSGRRLAVESLGLSFWCKRFSWLHFSAVKAADVAKWQTQRT